MTHPAEVTIVIVHSLSHLSDASVERGLAVRSSRERLATAELLPYLAEFDARRLFLRHRLRSTYEFCVKVLGFSEDAACKRIDVARKGRLYPGIFQRIADGSLHLTGAGMLSPHLTPANADELLAAAANQSKAGIERLLAEHFPQADLPTRLVPLVPITMVRQAEQEAVEPPGGATVPSEMHPPIAPEAPGSPAVPDLDSSSVPERINVLVPRPRIRPLAPERYGLQATIDLATHDDLRRAQELLRHQLPNGDVSEVLKRALRLLVRTLEKRKFGLTDRPRTASHQPSANPRRIPASVRRAVWERDGGRCTFVDESGARCESREWIEYDHVLPIAQGGETTVGNLRLRCRTHNQLAAEQLFGADFMRRKLESAREAASKARVCPVPPPTAATPAARGSRP